MIVTVDSAVGPLEVTVRYVSPVELEIIGGPAARLEVKPAGRLEPFVIDGNPYGGHFLAGLDCEPFAHHIYRAGVNGPKPGAVHASVFRDALVAAVAPHRDAILESLRAQRHAVLEKSVAHYEAEARRLRAEADKLTRRAARCSDLLASPVDATPTTCEDEAEDLCVEWLEAECWRPDDGAAEAARVAWAANGLVNEASVEAWVVARRAARGVCVAPDDRGHARGQRVGARK